MQIKFGNIKIEVPYEEFIEEFSNRKNPFEAMFLQCHQDFFNEFCKKAPSNMASYFEECAKMAEKYIKNCKPDKKEE